MNLDGTMTQQNRQQVLMDYRKPCLIQRQAADGAIQYANLGGRTATRSADMVPGGMLKLIGLFIVIGSAPEGSSLRR